MKPDLAQLLAELRAKAAARQAIAAQLCADARGIRMQHADGRRVAVTPELDLSGQWRVTYIDARGPSGHVTHNDKAAAVGDALLFGFMPQESRA